MLFCCVCCVRSPLVKIARLLHVFSRCTLCVCGCVFSEPSPCSYAMGIAKRPLRYQRLFVFVFSLWLCFRGFLCVCKRVCLLEKENPSDVLIHERLSLYLSRCCVFQCVFLRKSARGRSTAVCCTTQVGACRHICSVCAVVCCAGVCVSVRGHCLSTRQ